MAFVITDECLSCGSCAAQCPAEAIEMGELHYEIDAEGPDQYGLVRRRRVSSDDPANKDAEALYDEYRPGLRQYIHANAAGSYRLEVSRRGVAVDFYAGDSQSRSARFVLR